MNNELDKSQLLPIGTVLRGNLRITGHLASGGFGNTYLAENAFEEQVAVKEFFMRGITQREADTRSISVSNSANKDLFAEQSNKFKKEAIRIRKLDNDHIVKVHDMFEENRTIYYVMEYLDGDNLSSMLTKQGTAFTEQQVRNILWQVIDALETAHTSEILHLDIKPSNIIMTKAGIAKLIDFGASKQRDASGGVTATTGMSFTPGYAPSEQVAGNMDKCGPWTDFYALGATTYKLLTNRSVPKPDEVLDEEADAFDFSDVGDEMRQFILKMMTPKRANRPQDIGAVKSLLGGQSEEDSVTIVKNNPVSTEQEETIVRVGLAPKRKELSPVIQSLIDNMVYVEGGTFWMGGDWETHKRSAVGRLFGGPDTYEDYASDCLDDEKPRHQVTLSDFKIGRFVVTQREWQEVMGSNPSNFKGENLPVEQVSWNDCQTFIAKLNKLTGMNFRLPTEAEWEFAARGGNKSKGFKYSGCNIINDVAWWCGNVLGSAIGVTNPGYGSQPVATKAPNELGIYDMSGNVFEWCHDWYYKDCYANIGNVVQANPKGPHSGKSRICRGGSWASSATFCRVSSRHYENPTKRNIRLGFRLAL